MILWFFSQLLDSRSCLVLIRVVALLVRDKVNGLAGILLLMIVQGKQVGHRHLPMTLLKNLPLKDHLLSLLHHIVDLVLLSQDDELSVD